MATTTERLEARIDPAQKKIIERAARLTGRSLTDFVVGSAYGRALDTIERHQSLALGEEASLRFAAALAGEAAPNAALAAEAAFYRESIGDDGLGH